MSATLVFGRSVPARIRQQITQDNRRDLYCQMCGIGIGDIDDRTRKEARFRVGFVPNNGLSFRSDIPELRVLCSTCDQGAKNITVEKPTAIWLLSQIRRAGMQEQRAVFEWLSKKFGK